MKRYDSYKDSGVEWIGEIPSHWEVVKLKYNLRSEKYACKTGPFGTQLKGEDLQTEGDVRVYNQRNVIDNNFETVNFYVTSQKAKSLDSFYTQPNDLLVTSRGTIGRSSILPNNVPMGILHPCLIALRIDESKCLTEWLKLFINESDAFSTNIFLNSNATTIEVIYTDTIKNVDITIPPVLEQHKLLKYLDNKCSKIDKVIATQEKRVELLRELKQSITTRAVTRGINPNVKLKDSGVESIGIIPTTWEVCKTLYVLSQPITDGPHETPQLFDEGIPFVSAEAVSCGNGRIDFDHIRGYISESYYKECCKKYIPQKGDVYMIKSGATTGKVSIVDTDRIFTIWSPLAAFRCNNRKMLPYFLFYALQCPFYQRQVELGWNYGTQQNIGMRTLEKLYLPVPPIEEQEGIVKFIECRTSRLESSITKALRQIELLKEYKQSLITEVVTGKRKVV